MFRQTSSDVSGGLFIELSSVAIFVFDEQKSTGVTKTRGYRDSNPWSPTTSEPSIVSSESLEGF